MTNGLNCILLFLLAIPLFGFAASTTYKLPHIVSTKWINLYQIEISTVPNTSTWVLDNKTQKNTDYYLEMRICPSKSGQPILTHCYNVIKNQGNGGIFGCSKYDDPAKTCVPKFNNYFSSAYITDSVAYDKDSGQCVIIVAYKNITNETTIIDADCTPGVGIPEPPPVIDWCGMGMSTVTIDFGTLPMSSAVGAQKSSTLSVYCEGAPRYYFELVSGNNIKLSNNMLATLTIDGYSLNNYFTGTAGTSIKTITATLTGTPASSGAFSGQGVLRITYP